MRRALIALIVFVCGLWAPPLVVSLAAQSVVTELTGGNAPSNDDSFDTSSISPTAGTLLIAAVEAAEATTCCTVPTATGNGLTWVQMATVFQRDSPNNTTQLTLFCAVATSPSAGVVTFDFAAVTQLNVLWKIFQITNINVSGACESVSSVQEVTANATSGASVDKTCTLATFADATNNVALAVYATTLSTTFTAETATGWAEIDAEENDASPASTLGAQYLIGGSDLSALGTFGLSARPHCIAVELDHEAAVAGGGPARMLLGLVGEQGR